MTALKDSGKRHTYPSGATREPDNTKPRYDLLPVFCLEKTAEHYRNGACKYADRNWEKGLPVMNFYRAIMSHWVAFGKGDNQEDNLSAIVWNTWGIQWTLNEIRLGRLPAELDDRPKNMIHGDIK